MVKLLVNCYSVCMVVKASFYTWEKKTHLAALRYCLLPCIAFVIKYLKTGSLDEYARHLAGLGLISQLFTAYFNLNKTYTHMNLKITCTALSMAALSVIAMTSCSSSTPDGEHKAADTAAVANSKSETVQDEKIYPFMLGGIYFFNGYGGPDRVFNQMIKPEVHKAPGEKGFVTELETAYVKYFVFPFKKEDDPGGKEARTTLKEWWDIKNKEELEKSLNWLLNEGHQEVYAAYRKALEENGGAAADISKIDLKKYSLDNDDDAKLKLQLVKDNYSAYSRAGIKSWDLARYVNNVCIAFQADYLSSDEAIVLLSKVTPVARQHYDNWETYFKDFNLGRMFWTGGKDDGSNFTGIATGMLQGDYSLYKYLSFK